MRVTVAELTNRLKDKESVINELSEQRAKLENYTKKTLHAVQTKYMVAVSSHRNQINEKQERVDLLEKKLKEIRTSYSREQALMMSSFYEVSRCLCVVCVRLSHVACRRVVSWCRGVVCQHENVEENIFSRAYPSFLLSSCSQIGTEMQRRTMLPQNQAQGAGSWLASKRTEERAKRRNF